MAVDANDISAMGDLLSALDDVESGRATEQINRAASTGDCSGLSPDQIEQAAMRNILDGFNSVMGDEVNQPVVIDQNAQKYEQQHQQRNNALDMASDDMSMEEYLALCNGNQLQNADPTTGQIIQTTQTPQTTYQTPNGAEWVLVSEAYTGVKSLKQHSIQNSISGSIVLKNITLKESATAICNMLNEGCTINDPKMLGIISSGVQYTMIVEKMVKTLKNKRKVIRESNYDAAKQCDQQINNRKQEASNIKTDLLAYFVKHNISHK